MDFDFSFQAKLWLYSAGKSAWHFVSLPTDVADHIKAITQGRTKSFGSLSVKVTIGSTKWRTSLFRDNKANTYILPIKASVRQAENLILDQTLEITVELNSL